MQMQVIRINVLLELIQIKALENAGPQAPADRPLGRRDPESLERVRLSFAHVVFRRRLH